MTSSTAQPGRAEVGEEPIGHDAASGGPVVVVGSVNVDLVMTVSRLPGPGETVGGGSLRTHLGGKGANQAVAAARAGATTVLIGLVGDDDDGTRARRALEDEGVDTAALGVSSDHTGAAQIMVDARAENLIAVAPGANHRLDPALVREQVAARAAVGAVVVANLEVPLDAVTAAFVTARARGAVTILNPAPAVPLPPELLAAVVLLVPNEHELGIVAPDGPAALQQRHAQLTIVETRGAAGVRVSDADGTVRDEPAFPAQPVDTTGAGDAFVGVLAASVAAGRSLTEAVLDAQAAGACAVEQPGAQTGLPTRTEIIERRRSVAGRPDAQPEGVPR